jgi:hypothetical protein
MEVGMNSKLASLVMGIVLGLSLFVVAPSGAATETSTTATTTPSNQAIPTPPLPAAPAQQTIKGDVLNIEGEYLIVKDMSGHEIKLHVNKDTRTDNNRLKVGDKIAAVVGPDGHAQSIALELPPAKP